MLRRKKGEKKKKKKRKKIIATSSIYNKEATTPSAMPIYQTDVTPIAYSL